MVGVALLGTYNTLPSVATQWSVGQIIGWRLGAYPINPQGRMVYVTSGGGGEAALPNIRKYVQHPPFGSLDAASSPSTGLISVRGRALDPDTAVSIRAHVLVDGRPIVSLVADGARPDVGRAYGWGDNHGVSATLRAANGTRLVCLYAIDSGGAGSRRIGCRNVKVVNRVPLGNLEGVTSSQG